MRFENKVVIITWGAQGIGKATATLFAKEGAKVVIADCDLENGERTVKSIQENNGEVLFIHTDIANSKEVQKAVDTVLAKYHRIDVLFNNAGIYTRGDVVATAEETWEKIIQVNLKGVYLCSKAVIPFMRKAGGGVIINTSSSVGLYAAAPGIAAYAASKGGVTFLTKAMADDHLRDNIRVNCICPGPTDTPLLRKSRTDEQLQTFINSLPARRLLQPEEIARIVLFLSSDEASSITGAAFPVDRGQTAHL
jgi:NAD(P)-dependent dehydrogenase (short-subunit alcohol dehydrogenase family)